jgi:hypothetical protein
VVDDVVWSGDDGDGYVVGNVVGNIVYYFEPLWLGSMNSQLRRLFCQHGGRRPHCTALSTTPQQRCCSKRDTMVAYVQTL